MTEFFNDRPITQTNEDELQMNPYAITLCEFIQTCNTPTTIAIQGDWGSGKTSLMNLMQYHLSESKNCTCCLFNTWEFSQFNMGEYLTITFLNELIDSLKHQVDDKSSNTIANIKSTLSTIATVAVSHVFGETTSEAIKTLTEKTSAEQLRALKEQFSSLVNSVCPDNERLVIFIDDLDRLVPSRAVELLEVLKLFLNCEKCVFVLAIDTSVVFQGIRVKYGNDISDEKAQSFFDKLIELPFKIPSSPHHTNNLITKLTKELSLNSREEVQLIRSVTNGNPRSAKRLINTFKLLNNIANTINVHNEQYHSYTTDMLLSLSCLQLLNTECYNKIVNLSEQRFKELITKFENKNIQGRPEIQADFALKVKEYGLIPDSSDIEHLDSIYPLLYALYFYINTLQNLYRIIGDKVDKTYEVSCRIMQLTSTIDTTPKTNQLKLSNGGSKL